MNSSTSIQHVSDTAYWMATYRAQETKRADALFQDPLAEVLVGEHGKGIAESMKVFSQYAYWSLVTRTCIIDDYLLRLNQQGFQTIINIGAGLDTRPYRLDLPPETLWIEIDFPGVMEMKNQKLKEQKPKCRLERISLDLSNREARQKLFQELNARISPAVVLTEGVIPYLTEDMVKDLGRDLHSLSNIKLWIAEYYSPVLYPRFQSPAFAGRLGDAPFRFFPSDWFGLFQETGWTKKEIRYLYDEGMRVNRPFPLPWFVRILKMIASSEKFAKRIRLQAYVLFEKS